MICSGMKKMSSRTMQIKAVIALSRAARLLPGTFAAKKEIYQEAARLAFQWLTSSARPVGDRGLSRFQRGLPENAVIPAR